MLVSGTRLGPYEIQSLLGTGGMGEVYRARDTRLDRIVAIKVIPAVLSSDSISRQRFQREARAISALQHPNICTLYDVGQQDGADAAKSQVGISNRVRAVQSTEKIMRKIDSTYAVK
jgi:serine/threonine protein kinase